MNILNHPGHRKSRSIKSKATEFALNLPLTCASNDLLKSQSKENYTPSVVCGYDRPVKLSVLRFM